MGSVLSSKSLLIVCGLSFWALTACGDPAALADSSAPGSYPSLADAGACALERQGETIFVEADSLLYYCTGSSWNQLVGQSGDTTAGANGQDGNSCTALAIDSGIVVSCGGVVIDTLRNGADGQSGADGQDGSPGQAAGACDVRDQGDSLVVVCPDGTDSTRASWPKALCGGTAFDPAVQFCVGTNLHVKCAGAVFDPAREFCDARGAGRVYTYVTLGTGATAQVWMAQNLDFGAYLSGATSPQVDATPEIAEKWCYDNDAANCATYGGLYSWHSAMGLPASCDNAFADATTAPPCHLDTPHRGICPAGWHVPTQAEWATLDAWVDIANGGASGDGGSSLKSASGWYSGGNGTDAYGWNGLPAGHKAGGNYFYWQSVGTNWWTATGVTQSTARYRDLHFSSGLLDEDFDSKSGNGYSVRCVQD